MRRPWLQFFAFSLLACVCMGVDGCPTANKLFTHKAHVKELDMECTDCHITAKKLTHAGMPRPKECLECHKKDVKISEEIAKSLWEQGVFHWSAEQFLYTDEIRFSHQVHADPPFHFGKAPKKSVTCKECHGDMAKNKQVTAENLPKMEDCLQCHAKEGISNDCATCHREVSKSWSPKNHRTPAWHWMHGQEVEQNGFNGVGSNDCAICHRQSDCTQCHQQEAPRSHTVYWRNRGHGIDAAMDRAQCSVCHETGSCVRCHQESRPMSHQGAWGAPMQTHCISCHLPNTTSDCTVCHNGTPSHFKLAPRLTPTVAAHAMATSCMVCHMTGSQAVKHPVTSDGVAYCLSCHQR